MRLIKIAQIRRILIALAAHVPDNCRDIQKAAPTKHQLGRVAEAGQALPFELPFGKIKFGGHVLYLPCAIMPGDLLKSLHGWIGARSEEHTSELQSLMRISYAGFCLEK